ncbi:hypothetical protein E0500_023190 [Streptomyces sp. KM273126]|uniref:hypothetical protein n=1 Tax=Streptomyces sp. KM273126 TaxID=2545247 RepID=UPI00103DA0F0|nr:hypothetical protein [Streptomyces sp. KM273126]MBA2810221.1 hypothetical protein [Streptomyces sp. KM273126]
MPQNIARRRLLLLAAGGGLALALPPLTGAAHAATADATAPTDLTHPWIYTDASEKEALIDKITNSDWAKASVERLKAVIGPLADRHQSDPEWILSRMSMYWKEGQRYTQVYVKKQNFDYGEGNAPVPTVRFDATRGWNSNKNPPLEQRLEYSEDGSMVNQDGVTVPYAETGHMIRLNNEEILGLAQRAAFLHWVTGEEKYAAFASDIYWQWLMGVYYMKPMLDPTKSLGGPGGYEPGGICGYYDYEVIHDPMGGLAAVVYDFLYDYLDAHPHPHAVEIGKGLKELSTEVFKRFIDIGLVRGIATGNWNVNGFAGIVPAMMALDPDDQYADGKGRDYYLAFYTTTTTQYHTALPDILTEYDKVTGLWHESPAYSFGTVGTLLDLAAPVRRQGTDTIAGNDVLRRASLAMGPWLDARGNMVVFGDGRGGSPGYTAFERLLTYYTATGDTTNAAQVAEVLSNAMSAGQYNRNTLSSPLDIIFGVDLPTTDDSTTDVRTAYSPHHRHITMKNRNDVAAGLMATVYGGYNSTDHLNPNGLAIQLYGQGWALSPNCKSYESYTSADYVYSKGPAGANTIVPGYAYGPITVNAMEPAPPADAFVNTTQISQYAQFTDVSADEKRRQVAIIRTSDTTGYYVDVFRSDQADNDYIHHNLGQGLTLADAHGTALDLTAASDLGTAANAGYKYFTNPVSAGHDGDLRATWTVNASDSNPRIDMRMWMLGQEGRTVYRVDGPGTTVNTNVTPNAVNQKPQTTPTLIVRQQGNNAATAPFVSVFEPATDGAGTVREITRLAEGGTFTGLRVRSDGPGELRGRTEYVLSSAGTEAHSPHRDLDFTGAFGVVCTNAGRLRYLYLGNGRDLRHGYHRITADGDAAVAAGLVRDRDGTRYSADGWIRITLPCDGPVHRARVAYETRDGFVFAETTATPADRTVTGRVPAGYDVRIKVVTSHRP